MLAVSFSAILWCVLVTGARVVTRRAPTARLTKRQILEYAPSLLQLAVFAEDGGKAQDAGPEELNAYVASAPCAGAASCLGVPCSVPPCQLVPAGAAVDQLAEAAELSRDALREHLDAMDAIASSGQLERMSAEQRAQDARMAQVAAEDALHMEEVATAVQAARASRAEEDRASAEALAHQALQNATQAAAWDTERVFDSVRAREALNAERAINDAAKVAAESFVNGTAAYVDQAVRAGKAQAAADELRTKAADSSTQAESYATQAQRDEASALYARQKYDDLQRSAQESAASAETSRARAAEIALEANQSRWSLERKDQKFFDAREVARSLSQTAIDDLRRATEEALRNIDETSVQGKEHMEQVLDQVSRDQARALEEARRRGNRTMAEVFPDSRAFQTQNVLPLEIP